MSFIDNKLMMQEIIIAHKFSDNHNTNKFDGNESSRVICARFIGGESPQISCFRISETTRRETTDTVAQTKFQR